MTLQEQIAAMRCPPGSTGQLDIDTNKIGCFTAQGALVPEMAAPAKAGLGVLGWAAIGAGVIVGVAWLMGRE